MQPLSLSSSIRPLSLNGNVSSSVAATRQASTASISSTGASTGQFDMGMMLPMLVQMLQVFMQLMQVMSSGGNTGGTTTQTPASTPPDSGSGNGGSSGGTPVSTDNGGSTSPYGGGSTPVDNGGNGNGSNGPVSNGGKPNKPNKPNNTKPTGKGSAADQTIEQRRNMNYSDLSAEERVKFNDVSRDSAAIIHLGGRAHISDDATKSGVSSSARIYNTVLNNRNNFSPNEVALVEKWSAQEKAKYGFVTGENLDHAFIEEMGNRNGTDKAKMQQYHNAVDQRVAKLTSSTGAKRNEIIADSNKQLEIVSDLDELEKRSGLTHAEQAVYRLAGHAVLYSGTGQVDGDILGITLGNKKSLDNRDFGAENTNIDKETRDLMDADFADDGEMNGTSLRAAQDAVMDKIFLGSAGIKNSTDIKSQAVQAGVKSGRTMQQIQQSIAEGGKQALNDFKNMAKDHTPGMLAAAGTMAGAAAICPFLGGMAAGAAGIAAGQKAMKK